MEINLLHGDPLNLADQAFLFKRTAREAALRHKMYATFMAKPHAKEPGSAMHIHQSVVDTKTGAKHFQQPRRHALAAVLLAHCRLAELSAGGDEPVRAQREFVPTNHAAISWRPINVQWGYDNRTAGLRVPMSDPEARRVENRLGGADANPYIAIAASLACGYLGMVQNLQPSEPITGSAHDLPWDLPRSLDEALNASRIANRW